MNKNGGAGHGSSATPAEKARSSATPEEKARVALQNLLRRNSEVKSPSLEAGSGSVLSQLLRAEIAEALCKPAHAARLREVEGQMSKFLDKVSPPTNGSGAAENFQPPPRRVSVGKRNSVQQTEALAAAAENLMLLVEEKPAERPRPLPRLRRALTLPDDKDGNMRRRVNEAQRRLCELDNQVTNLTRTLKMERMKTWEQQRDSSSTEAQINRIIAERSKELPTETQEEEKELEKQEQKLAAELRKVRPQATHWYTRASHQDRELQQTEQERRCGGSDPCWIRGLVKSSSYAHPSGMVWLVDSDSDDDIRVEPPRNPYGKGGGGGRGPVSNSDKSDDEDSEDNVPRGKDRAIPPPPPKQTSRAYLDADEDDSIEGGSSLPSPASESATSPQGTSGEVKSPSGSGGLLTRGGLQEQRNGQKGAAPWQSDGLIGKGPRGGSDSDSSSADEAPPPKPTATAAAGTTGHALSMAALAGKTFADHGRPGAAAVPPMPELAGGGAGGGGRGRSATREDEAEEVSSEEIEDIEEDETSRSC